MAALGHVKSNTIGDATGTVTVYNSAGNTTTAAATNLVRPSDWNSVHQFTNTISGNTSGTSTAAGTNLVFGGTNGITLSHSTAAGGATMWIDGPRDYSRLQWENLNRQSMNLITNITATGVTQRPMFFPCEIGAKLTVNQWMIAMSRQTNGSNAFTVDFALYTVVNSNQISRLASGRNVFSHTATASISGARRFQLTGMETAGTALTPGVYYAMLAFSHTATASANYSLQGEATANPPLGLVGPGTNNVTTANLSSIALERFQGLYTTTTASPPAAVSFAHIQHWTTMVKPYLYMGST